MRILEKYPRVFSVRTLAVVFTVLVIAATIHRILLGAGSFNNYAIFRWSFYNLLHGNDLYALHPEQYYDLYKYSPTFALLMAPFYTLPSWAGLFAWNLMNALLPLWAVNRLAISQKAKAFVLIFIFIALLSSIQNAQSNGIMAGLMIGAFTAFERKQVVLAALLICLGFYLKIFAAAVGILFLFYDQKPRFLLACAAWGILFGVLPVVVAGVDGLIFQYKSWLHLLANDPAHELNYSIMTLTQRWFNFTTGDLVYLVPGVILLAAPLMRKKEWEHFPFRLLYLASILVWVVIFNHKAESPTYVIACCGVALWALTEERSLLRTIMLWLVFVLTILSPTDLFPPYLREEFVKPLCLIALPCILAWGIMTWRLSAKNFSNRGIEYLV